MIRTKSGVTTAFFVLIALIAFVVLSAGPAKGQVLYGSIAGTVQDSTGGAVPNAMVTIANRATGQSRQSTTNSDGFYTFPDVLAGDYTVTITAPGFHTSQTNNIEVTINTVTRGDAQLQVGERAETITVEASSAAIQTESADVHVALSSQAITQLPLPGYRNYQSLINLVPGATPAAYQNAVSGSPARSLNTNINGTTNTSNNTRLDGALNMRGSLPAQSLYVPPPESIETVNIATNSFDAEQGFAGGAAINVITKSGTNQFHGVIFEDHTDSRLTDRNFFNVSSSVLPKDILNNYGGTLGGPIREEQACSFSF